MAVSLGLQRMSDFRLKSNFRNVENVRIRHMLCAGTYAGMLSLLNAPNSILDHCCLIRFSLIWLKMANL